MNKVKLWRIGKPIEVDVPEDFTDADAVKLGKSFLPMFALKRGRMDFGRERFFAIWINRKKIFFRSWPIGQ